jgi:hypothetical protein
LNKSDFLLEGDLIMDEVFDPIVSQHILRRSAIAGSVLGLGRGVSSTSFQALEGSGDAVLTVLSIIVAFSEERYQ